jgi:hypothetical protein
MSAPNMTANLSAYIKLQKNGILCKRQLCQVTRKKEEGRKREKGKRNKEQLAIKNEE